MAELPIVITDQGRAEHINADNTGTDKLKIVEVRLGSGQYELTEANKTQAALQNEIKTINTISGDVVSPDTIHVTIMDESEDAYSVGEIGLYTETGTLYAVYAQTEAQGWIIEKAAPSTLLISTDILLDELNADIIEFGDLVFSNPPASETLAGVIRTASNAAIDEGNSTNRAVTPAGLKHRYGNVNNTPDSQKPVSEPQQTALNQKADKDGDYSGLRARGTTKGDVGLDSVRNTDYISAGTRMLFQQSSAPTGWTKITDHDNKALRVVSGSAGTGGANSFTAAFNSSRDTSQNGGHSHSISVNSHTLSTSRMPSHRHLSGPHNLDVSTRRNTEPFGTERWDPSYGTSRVNSTTTGHSNEHKFAGRTSNTGGGNSHSHGASASSQPDHSHSLNLDVQYLDVIIAEKQ